MARAMWKGAIQFGLVTIPIKLYLATESKGISFHMLHKKDLSRIQMKIFCPVEDEIIPRARSQALVDAFRPGQVRLTVIDDAQHNTLDAAPEYLASVREFLTERPGGAEP